MQISTIGIDIAKNVFQVHGVDAHGKVVVTRQLRRAKVIEFFRGLAPCLVGMEACATAHYWTREITELGHDVKLISPSYVKAYVRRQKNDAADAAAICEAVTRPSMRFVPAKTPEQQAALAVHRTRALLISQRTQITNALRAHLAELGLVADQGRDGLAKLIAMVKQESTLQALPLAMLHVLGALVSQLAAVQQQISDLDRVLHEQLRASPVSRRLESIPGVGVIGATAIAATVIDPGAFKSGRDLAAWIGLVPKQNSTGGKEKLGGISKQGDRYLRRLLVAGAMAVVQHARRHPEKQPWIEKLLARKPAKVVAIAVANKTARIAWAIMTKGGIYQQPALAAAA